MSHSDSHALRLTRAFLHLDRLSRNIELLRRLAGNRPLWPCIKANAYGHGADIIAGHLLALGCDVFCVADVGEALALKESGIEARFIVMSAMLPEHSESIVGNGFEPVVCTREMAVSLAREAKIKGKTVPVHVKVDTGMGRIGIRPDEAAAFVELLGSHPELEIKGLMSHFCCADEADKSVSYRQIRDFKTVSETLAHQGIPIRHMANSAAIFDLPEAGFDAARPGISIYGLVPSAEIINPAVRDLEPVLEWKSRVTFLKEAEEGAGLSYGHDYRTPRRSLIATIPVGYGDGFSRRLSGKAEFLIGGVRCPQVGRITMDMCLADVTALRGKIQLGDEVVVIGEQGGERISADDLARKLGTINYEIVTGISQRVPRIALGEGGG
ncbi:MAG: alanine racemase [Gammaproteobacteria bacterium]